MPTARKRKKKAAKRTPRKKAAARNTWHFGPGAAQADATMKEVVGGKGANLAEMCRVGLPVPPGFTIATTVCPRYYQAGRKLPQDVRADVRRSIGRLEKETGKRFGDPARPLLVSVRSGAAISMPGMMDTVLNLGLNDEAMEGLARQTGNRRFALDARRRFIQMFANVVEGLDLSRFEAVLENEEALACRSTRTATPSSMPTPSSAWSRKLPQALQASLAKRPFPEDPEEQLAALHLKRSSARGWESRAVEYRKHPQDRGPASAPR